MNRHDDSTDRVRTWLHEEGQGELPDWVLRQTFETTRSTPQRRGLRGWLASMRIQGGSSTRRRDGLFTFATISAVAAAAILAVGVFVTPEEPPTPGVEAPELTVEEQMFTGSFWYGSSCEDEEGNEIDYCWHQSAVLFDDPRFQGTVIMHANPDYTDQGIYRNQFTISTDEGAWVGDPVPGILTGEDDGAPSVHLFTGEGAYAGLSAVATVVLSNGGFRVEGYVVDGGFPELP